MSEIVDLVMPVLQAIQARLGTIERDLADVKQVQAEHGAKLEELEIHLAYLTGIESQNRFDLQAIKKRIKEAEERVSALDPQP